MPDSYELEVTNVEALRPTKPQPLGLLSCVNGVSPQNIRVHLVFDSNNKLILRVSGDGDVDGDFFSTSFYKSGLVCETFSIRKGKTNCTYYWARFLDSANTTNLLEYKIASDDRDGWCVEFVGFNNDSVPPLFNHPDKICEKLCQETWFGSKFFAQGIFTLDLLVLASSYRIASKPWCFSDVTTGISYSKEVQSEVGRFHFSSCYGDSQFVAKEFYGGFVSPELKGEIVKAQNGSNLKGEFELDLHETGRFLFPASLPRNVFKQLEDFFDLILADKEWLKFQQSCTTQSKIDQVIRLDARKEALRTAFFVFRDDVCLQKVPSSEMEVVALHFKLEGMGALPFSKFEGIEYTPKLGIDSIANFKIEAHDQLNHFATVEYEYMLNNFFAHGHPPEHTDLIVCWQIDDKWINEILRTPLEWLSLIDILGRRMPIAEICSYPGLQIKKIGES